MGCTWKPWTGVLVFSILLGMAAPCVQAAHPKEEPAPIAQAAEQPSATELRQVMHDYILKKYRRVAQREPIPMDCQSLQKRPDRSYMEEYALYRWWREQGKWEQALAACDASREKALAYDKRLNLTPESAAPYLTDRGELLFLLGREAEADAAFQSAVKHLKEDPDRVLDSPYLTDEDRRRLQDARQLRQDELEAYHAQLMAICEAEHSGS